MVAYLVAAEAIHGGLLFGGGGLPVSVASGL